MMKFSMKKPSITTKIPGLKSSRWRQWGLVGFIALLLYGGLYLIFATGDGPKAADTSGKPKVKVTTHHVQPAGAQLDPRETWIGGAGAQVADQGARLQQQETFTKSLQEKIAKLDKELQEQSAKQRSVEIAPVPRVQPPVTAGTATTPAAPQRSLYPPGTPAEGAVRHSGLPAGVTLPPGYAANAADNPFGPSGGTVGVSIGHVSLNSSDPPRPGSPTSPGSPQAPGPAKTKPPRTTGTYLPIGFVRTTLIGGIDAPTGGQAQNNPLPVFFRVDDLAVLPNHFRANVKSCFIVGAAYGSLSAERAYARIETLSCVRHDGRVIESAAHGVVYGEDGKLGMRGRLVSKQGQVLANALLAGVISGIGQGIQYQNTSTTVTPAGTISQSNNGDNAALRAGVAGGVGRALDRLANYYITLAEKLFPVIEIDSNRHIDVAFTKGTGLEAPLPAIGEAALEEEDSAND